MQTNQILAGLLGVQVLLGVATWWPRTDADTAPVALVDAASADLTAIEIEGNTAPGVKAEPVRLVKQGDTWVVASANNYPADPARVGEVLDRLTGLQLRDPISTQATSHQQLQVADDTHTRKITLVGAGGKTTVFYLGAGQGSAANLRKAGSDDVYLVHGFTAWSIGDAPARYFDTSYVKVDPAKVATLTVRNASGTLTLQHAGDAWTAADDAARPIDGKAANALARKLLDVRMSKPIAQQVDPSDGLDGTVRVEWTTNAEDAAATSGGYTLGAERDGARLVKADGKDWVVGVAPTALAQATTVTWADLAPKAPPAD